MKMLCRARGGMWSAPSRIVQAGGVNGAALVVMVMWSYGGCQEMAERHEVPMVNDKLTPTVSATAATTVKHLFDN